MGVKKKAAAAILVLLLFLGSLWVYGGLDSHWDSCLKGYNQVNRIPQLSNSSRSDVSKRPHVLSICPGQNFQVSVLISHLLAAPAYTSDVLVQPYLSSWDELVKFMDSLGPMVSHSVRSMISSELDRGLVDFHQQTDSGCRTLLRLHRALLWLKLFLQNLAKVPATGRPRSPSELCREAYQSTLAQHHTWFVRRAAELAFIAMPERGFFFRLLCVQNQEGMSVVLNKAVDAIGEVYDRTQKALEEKGMLDLP